MNDKMKLAEKLYDAVGGIDDHLVQEAGAPFRKRRSRTVLKAVLLAAIIQTLVIALLVGAISAAMFITDERKGDAAKDSGSDDAETLPGVISVTKASKENVDLTSGNCAVIIQYPDREECTVIAVTERRMNSLLEMYEREERAASDNSYDEVRIWLCDKNGFVISPHLKRSNGNVGYAELFDYSPEMSLSRELTQTLDRMTGRE